MARTKIPPSDGLWKGRPAFLVGGGPSLKTFHWPALLGAPNIIVVNRAYRDCNWADYFFTEDDRFIKRFSVEDADGWRAFEGLKVFHCLDPVYRDEILGVDPELHVIDRKRVDKYWSRSFADGLSYSSNSMVGAINMACIMGADPIYLLGVDCKSTGGKCSNYHDDYQGDWVTGDHQYLSFKSDFEHWVAPHAKMAGHTIINLNVDSGVDCWPKRDWREVLPCQSLR